MFESFLGALTQLLQTWALYSHLLQEDPVASCLGGCKGGGYGVKLGPSMLLQR